MSSRDDILTKLRQANVPDVPEPQPFTQGIVFDDPHAQFARVLESVGGRCEVCPRPEDVNARLQELAVWRDAVRRCSLVEGIGDTNFDLESINDPHELADVDFAVLPGHWAVAENAAVWVNDEGMGHRVLYFIVQHLALVVPASRMLHNLHQAYERLKIGTSPFGCWVSGPSKTADIEQSLVIGAHGSRSLTVFVVGSPDDVAPQ